MAKNLWRDLKTQLQLGRRVGFMWSLSDFYLWSTSVGCGSEDTGMPSLVAQGEAVKLRNPHTETIGIVQKSGRFGLVESRPFEVGYTCLCLIPGKTQPRPKQVNLFRRNKVIEGILIVEVTDRPL